MINSVCQVTQFNLIFILKQCKREGKQNVRKSPFFTSPGIEKFMHNVKSVSPQGRRNVLTVSLRNDG